MFALILLAAAPPAGASEPAVRRVLMISIPYVAWSDLGQGVTPHLDALLDKSSVANLSLRAARRRTTPGDGYATIGAGTRAGSPRLVDGIALAPDEPFEGGTAGDAYQRRFGHKLRGAAGVLTAASYETINDDLLYGAEVGSLGEALHRAGVTAAVIANSDPSRTSGDQTTFVRPAAVALMTRDGQLDAGRVDRGLLIADPAAPYGHRLDPDAVLSAFDAVWRKRAVVLVEASDVARAESYGDLAGAVGRAELKQTTLRWTDTLVTRLLERVDPAHDAVMVVAPATPKTLTRLTVAAVSSPKHPAALARSASTRRSGFVTIADIGPTVLDLVGVERPASMEGRPLEPGRKGASAGERRNYLVDTERDARFRDTLVTPVYLGFVIAEVLLSMLAVVVLRQRRRERARAVVELGALALLAFLPCTYFAGLLPFSRLGKTSYVAFVAAGALGLAAAIRTLDRGRNALRPVVTVLGIMLAVIAGSAMTGSSLQLNTVFGDSPIVAGRFSGINNLTFAQLATVSVLLAGFCCHHLGARRGAWVGAGLLAGAIVIDGMPIFGADVGGVLSSVPAFALVAGLLLGIRFGPRIIAAGLGGTAMAITTFVLFDLSRPSDSRSHLGRLFEQMDVGGWDAFATVVERKLDANLSILTHSPWTPLVPAGLAFVAYLGYRSPSALSEIQRRVPELRIAMLGILVAGVLGFALNDSGIAVPGMMLGVLTPVLIYLSVRWT